MSNLIEQYTLLHNQIKERAVYINNLLSEAEMPEHLDGGMLFCGVELDSLGMTIDRNDITLEYFVPWEDYSDTWTIQLEWTDMEDDDIISAYVAQCESEYQVEQQREINRLKNMAELYGYMLTPNKNGGIDE